VTETTAAVPSVTGSDCSNADGTGSSMTVVSKAPRISLPLDAAEMQQELEEIESLPSGACIPIKVSQSFNC
jgi:hypothetical protein